MLYLPYFSVLMELVHGKEAEVMENHSTSSRGLSPSRPANTGSGLHVNTNQCLSNGYEYVINMYIEFNK